MRFSYRPYSLRFRHPFGVSSNTRTHTPAVFVMLEHGNLTGYGEACLPPYLGETPEETTRFFEMARPYLEAAEPANLEQLLPKLDSLSSAHNAAKAALDMALHDLAAKEQNKSFGSWQGLPSPSGVLTSLTIGIDSEDMLVTKIEEARDFKILKIKAGTADDQALVSLVRKHTAKPLYIDVNQGWRNKDKALEMAQWMSGQNVLLLEQPMPVEMKAEMQWLTARSPVPTIADESVKRLRDLEQLDGAFSGINIKLMKCTGLGEALKMIGYCKQNDLKVMLGCMAESSCATTAMAQLAGLADFIDLDAPQLYLNDPFKGINYRNGQIFLNELPGMGAEPVLSVESP